MNAVIGLTDLLGRTRLDTEQAEYVGMMEVAGRSLLKVINDVLDLSKIEAGEMILERAPFSLPRLIDELACVMRVQADAKGIALEVDADAHLPAMLEGDVTCLNQILTNLLANAVKFTAHGTVGLKVSMLGRGERAARFAFEVEDSGIGIEATAIANIFQPFTQADASTTRRFGGTGLGLSIVKRLVDLMGGTIEARSVPGTGSVFRVELEFALVAPGAAGQLASTAPSTAEHQLAGARILVVDDNEVNLDVARYRLELQGARVNVASNGEQAVELLRLRPDEFDVVLMDVQMPVMDGCEATRLIRAEPGLGQLPVIALTAGALGSERQRATDAGMNDFISKPFDAKALVTRIQKHLRLAAKPLDAAGGVRPPERLQDDPQAEAWPEISGIDTDDVKRRLGGDRRLYRVILSRWLRQPVDESVPSGVLGQAELEACAMRMHRLKGPASMLGARAIHAQAEEVEAACAAGDSARVVALSAAVAAQLVALRACIAQSLESGVLWGTQHQDVAHAPDVQRIRA
jgi:CheY-like chemotaxis protein/HPt (histidine-containing phosphotransfer) domain-containing protein